MRTVRQPSLRSYVCRIVLVASVAFVVLLGSAFAQNLDQIHYRWRNDFGAEVGIPNGTIQVSGTSTIQTNSNAYTPVTGMQISPGVAGDFLVFFSATVEADNDDSTQLFSIFVDGTQITHTEREVFTEGSIPDTPFNVVTQAFLPALPAGALINVQWRTDQGTVRMRGRTLTTTQVNGADVMQATATNAITTGSGTDVLASGMTITPGAGDYLVWFSSSVRGEDDDEETWVSLYHNGVQLPHTERLVDQEESLEGDTYFPVGTHALINGVGGGENIEVRWRSGGDSRMLERTLTVYRINPADAFQATATIDDITTSGTFSQVTGMTLTPGAGDYHVWFTSSLEGTDGDQTMDVALYVNGVQVQHTERDFLVESSFEDTLQSQPVALHAFVTGVGAADVIEVRWREQGGGTATIHERTLTAWRDTPGAPQAWWTTPEDTKLTGVVRNTTQRLRFEVAKDSGPSPALQYQLQVSEGANCAAGTYNPVPTGSGGHWQIVGSMWITDGEATQNVTPGLTDEKPTFVPGELKDASNTTGPITLANNRFTEMEFAIQATNNAVLGQDYCFQLYDVTSGSVLTTYTVYGQAQIEGGTLVLAEHDAGQQPDKFTTVNPVTTELFGFKLSTVGSVTISNLDVRFTTGGGVSSGNVNGAELYYDANADGVIDGGDTLIQGGVNGSGSRLAFTTDFPLPVPTGSNFLVRATVSSLVGGDTTTFSLSRFDIDETTGPIDESGSVSGATHTQDTVFTLSDHDGGQLGDQFTSTSPITTEVFAFNLARSGSVTVTNVRVNFTTGGGVANGDVGSGELWRDNNDDGVINGGDTLIQGGITPVGGVLTFTTNFQPSSFGSNYLVEVAVTNLVSNDTTTFTLSTADIDIVEGGVTEVGATTPATHTQDETVVLSNHDAGQTADKFTGTTPVTDVLFGFKLVAGTVTVDTLRVNFTTGLGVANGDVTAGELWADVNNDGTIDGGDTFIEIGVTPVGGVLTFTTDFLPAAGTNYLVRATVANVTDGDSTTFSVGPADIDEVEVGVTEVGSISNAAHFDDGSGGLNDVYFSVGTTAVDRKTGSPTIAITGGTATLSVAQAGVIGVGDVIDYGASLAFIHQVVSPTVFEVRTATGLVPANTSAIAVNSIMRTFSDITDAEGGTAANIGTTNLVTADVNVYWVVYNDAPLVDSVQIDGYIADATHHITITAADAPQVVTGASQRHDGTAATGAVVRPSAAAPYAISIADPFTVVEWLDIDGTNVSATGSNGVEFGFGSQNATLQNLIIHDWDETSDIGASVTADNVILRNIFLYNNEGSIYINGDNSIVQNVTIYNGAYGLLVDVSSGHTIENVLSTSSAPDFSGAGTVTTSNNNISSDDTADDFGGGGHVLNVLTVDQFTNLSGPIDLHLRVGADAIDTGVDLSVAFTSDIDADSRPFGPQWDVGADEAGPSPFRDVYYSVGTSVANLRTGAPNITIVGGTATLDVAQTADVGVGDVINFGGGTEVYIHRVTSPTELEVRTVTGTMPADTGPALVNSIGRVFNDWQTAAASSGTGAYLGNFDLPAANVRLTWVGYNDGPFAISSTIFVNVYNTDATRHLKLTAAGASQVVSGASQRHRGTEGAGVVLDVQGATGTVLGIGDGFTRVEWIEIDGNSNLAIGVNVAGGGNDASFEFMLIHDVVGRGFAVNNNNVEIRNCIVHDTGNDGINLNGTGNELYNCTLYMTGAEGVEVAGTATVENVISMNAASGSFHNDGTMTTNNNIASDGSATSPGGGGAEVGNVGNLDNRTATDSASPGVGDWVVFENIAGRDFHLKASAENDAIDNGKNLSSRFYGDIDGGARALPWDIGADDLAAATAVELVSFDALSADGAIELVWETGGELDNLGFHLYRSLDESGPYESITARVIPGLGSSPAGARYHYRDEGLVNGTAYYYQLEDIETTGETALHGPVSATPLAGSPSDGGPDEHSPNTPALGITYGDPSLNRINVVQQTNRGAIVELVTEGFYAVPQDDGSVAIEVPGFDVVGEEGAPSMPVKHHWVGAIAGRKVEITSVRGRMQPVASGWMVSSELPELLARPSGTVQARRRRGSNVTTEGLYPAAAARVATVAFQGESKKALLELAPLRWDARTGELLLARRLVIKVAFRGVERSELSLDDRGRGRRRTRKLESNYGVLARFATTDRGLYNVRYEDVFGASGTIPVNALRLSRQGEDVAFHVAPSTRGFRRGSVLYFVSDGASANPYGNEAVYELQLATADQPGIRMETVEASPPAATEATFYWKRLELEVNRFYQAGLLDAPDLWLWDLLLAPQTKQYPFEVTALASTVESARIDVWLQGTSDTPAFPDHHVRLYLNGTLLTETTWNGKRAHRLTAEVAPGLLAEGNNVVELENVGDTEASYSTVMLDRFTVEYPRRLVAESGELRGRFSVSGSASPGFAAHVLDISEASPRWVESAGAVAVEAGRSYLMVAPSALRAPEIRRPIATTLTDRLNQADYLVIGPRAFIDAASPLLSHRSEQGLVSKGAALEEVYAEFGHGEATPEAIRAFIAYAYHEWQAPSPRYVVLLGDGHYDYKDYAKLGGANPVPQLMVETSYLWTASDPALAAVNGDDLLPDVAIGRLPAASTDEVRALVEKIIAWESNGYSLDGTAVVVADNPDAAGDFVAAAEDVLKRLPAGSETTRIYLSELGVSETKSKIVQAFDDGAALMSYMGHGGIHLWADENVFASESVGLLSEQSRQPLLLTMNCLNGYFHFPHFGSLAEEVVKARGRGAIAAFSPSGLSLTTPAQRYQRALLDELYSGRHLRLGDAVLGAQETYIESGAFPELVTIYHLFGDPALTLR